MIYKATVIDALRELADESLQRIRWLSVTGPEVSSFAEVHCQLFDDTGLGDALEKGRLVFEKSIDAKLRKLGDMMGRIDSSLPPDILIQDAAMETIRECASEILKQLSVQRTS